MQRKSSDQYQQYGSLVILSDLNLCYFFANFCCCSETWYDVGCVVQCLLLTSYDVGHMSFVQNRPDCRYADRKITLDFTNYGDCVEVNIGRNCPSV